MQIVNNNQFRELCSHAGSTHPPSTPYSGGKKGTTVNGDISMKMKEVDRESSILIGHLIAEPIIYIS